MSGLSRHTLQRLDEEAHLAQSIKDILTTPLGSRVMRREYGSNLPELIDRPQNGETIVDVIMVTAEALERWEPRVDVTRVEIATLEPGVLSMALSVDVLGIAQVIPVEIGVAA